MIQTLDLETVLAALLDELGRVVPFDRALVVLLDSASLLRVRATMQREHRPKFVASRPPRFVASDHPGILALLSDRKGLVIDDTHASPRSGHPILPEFGHSWMGVPILVRDEAIGLFSLWAARARAFSPKHLQWAEALCAPKAAAIRNAMLFERVGAERERLQGISRRLVDQQEHERRVVARALHDGAGQALSSIKIGLRLLERETTNPAVIARAAKLQLTAEGVQQSLQRLATDLRPPVLDHLGLAAALSQLAEGSSEAAGVEIQFEALGVEGQRLAGRIETEIFRVAQEALTNAIRHSGAGQIGIILRRGDSDLQLIVEDNGRGFDPAPGEAGKRFGLAVMRERVETLGGTLLIDSSPGYGTTVVVEVPVVCEAR